MNTGRLKKDTRVNLHKHSIKYSVPTAIHDKRHFYSAAKVTFLRYPEFFFFKRYYWDDFRTMLWKKVEIKVKVKFKYKQFKNTTVVVK